MDEGAPIHALVIDDSAEMRRMIAQILLTDGHIAVCAESVEEGLQSLPHYTFQVAYLDHNLPGMEGLAFGEWLRENNPHIQIALVTAELDDGLERLCADHDITYIPKPFDVGDITGQVTRFLERHRDRIARAERENDPAWAPPLAAHAHAIGAHFDMPGVPSRIERRLELCINEAMAALHRRGATEHDRVMALTGLLCAEALGVRLPKGRSGRSLFEEFDQLMIERGRRPEFTSIHARPTDAEA